MVDGNVGSSSKGRTRRGQGGEPGPSRQERPRLVLSLCHFEVKPVTIYHRQGGFGDVTLDSATRQGDGSGDMARTVPCVRQNLRNER